MLYRTTILPATLDLLKEIMAIPALSDFYLAGGTSLALQIGHGLSVDLEFFGQRPFIAQELLDELHDLGPITIMHQSKSILVLNIREIKVDFVNYRYAMIYDPIQIEGIRLVSVQDIAAMKLAAIAGRGKKRDFYDLFFLLQKYSLPELMRFYFQKYEEGSEFLVTRSLTYFEDADLDEDVVLVSKQIGWNGVKEIITAEVKKYYR